jgi:hypothetical protein
MSLFRYAALERATRVADLISRHGPEEVGPAVRARVVRRLRVEFKARHPGLSRILLATFQDVASEPHLDEYNEGPSYARRHDLMILAYLLVALAASPQTTHHVRRTAYAALRVMDDTLTENRRKHHGEDGVEPTARQH